MIDAHSHMLMDGDENGEDTALAAGNCAGPN